MKATYHKKRNRFFAVTLTVAVLCCFLNFAAARSGVSGIFAGALGAAVTPVQKLVSGAHGFIEDKLSYFQDMEALQEENRKLREEILSLQRQVSELEPAQKENEMLYHFLELKRERHDIRFVNADIISRSTSNYTSEFTIDKGSIHGVEKDMAVMTEDGSLLGIITEAGATYARGKTLTSYDLSVGIKNERTGAPGLLSGNLELSRRGLCQVSDLPDTADYMTGDILRTSGLGNLYPPGLYVGSVTELTPDALGYTVSAVVKPSASIFDTDMVMVITDFDRTYEPTSSEAAQDFSFATSDKTPPAEQDGNAVTQTDGGAPAV